MMKLKFILCPLVLVAGLLSSCDMVHEFPQPGQEIDPTAMETVINIDCKVQLEGINVITKSGSSDIITADSSSLYERRFIVNIHSNEYVDTLVESHIITRPVADTSDLIVETKLQTRKYKLIVWMDYVRRGETSDLYYTTSNGADLTSIHQLPASKYVAGTDFKDAQSFVSDVDLTPYAGQWYANITIPAVLTRPVAKITLLTNDLAAYAESIGYTGDLSELADDITFEISYDGYFPTCFNAHTGRLNDSELGYKFTSESNYPYRFEENDYNRIGFDYVFVNGESSSVTISVIIKTKSGKLINMVNNVVVPIIRGKETVIIYKFLTKEYVPGIGINPAFDGEFNYYV